MNFLESLLGLGQGIGLIILFVLIIKIWYWISLYNGIANIEKNTHEQNKEIIKNQKEIIKLLSGEVEERAEEPEEVDKLKYI